MAYLISGTGDGCVMDKTRQDNVLDASDRSSHMDSDMKVEKDKLELDMKEEPDELELNIKEEPDELELDIKEKPDKLELDIKEEHDEEDPLAGPAFLPSTVYRTYRAYHENILLVSGHTASI